MVDGIRDLSRVLVGWPAYWSGQLSDPTRYLDSLNKTRDTQQDMAVCHKVTSCSNWPAQSQAIVAERSLPEKCASAEACKTFPTNFRPPDICFVSCLSLEFCRGLALHSYSNTFAFDNYVTFDLWTKDHDWARHD
jgi:hypothetical protein